MFRERFDSPYGAGRRPLGRGFGYYGYGHGGWGGPHRYGRGPWGRPRRRRLLRYLAAAFIARAALRYARKEFGAGRPGRGPWGWDERPYPYGGDWGHGAPWRRGGHGWRHEHGGHHGRGPDPAREAARTLRGEIGALIGLLRDARRRGAPDARQMEEIRAALGDARKRIAAILAETQPPYPTV